MSKLPTISSWVGSPPRRIDLNDPLGSVGGIHEIATALARIHRCNGHSPISVAVHSILVADQVESEAKLAALLHDAAEAYLGDQVSNQKKRMSLDLNPKNKRSKRVKFSAYEDEWLSAIFTRLGVDWPSIDVWTEVGITDAELWEKELHWMHNPGLFPAMTLWSHEQVVEEFIALYYEYGGKHG